MFGLNFQYKKLNSREKICLQCEHNENLIKNEKECLHHVANIIKNYHQCFILFESIGLIFIKIGSLIVSQIKILRQKGNEKKTFPILSVLKPFFIILSRIVTQNFYYHLILFGKSCLFVLFYYLKH